MTAPADAAVRFGWGLLLGASLGLFYGFLRPLRPKRTTLADGIFLLAAFYLWLLLQFQNKHCLFRLQPKLHLQKLHIHQEPRHPLHFL